MVNAVRAGLLLGAACAGAGCVVAADRCDDDEQCVAAFGWGHTCGAQGECVVLEPADGCAGAWPPDVWQERDAYRDAIVFGSVLDTSLYPLERDAVRLAVDQVNDLGGIGGMPVAVLECDPAGAEDAARTDRLQQAAGFLTAGAGVAAVVGPVTSADTAVVAAAAGAAVLVSPGASGLSLSVTAERVWRTVPSDEDIAQAIVRSMIDEGWGPAVVVHEDSLAQRELAEQLSAFVSLASAEYPAMSTERSAFGSATERDARIVDAAYANADVVVLLSEDPQDYVEMLLAASAIEEYRELTVVVGPAAYRPQLLQEAASAAVLFPNLRGIRSATREGAVADVFRASFSSAHGGSDPDASAFAGQSYDSAWSVFSAALWSGMRTGRVDGAGLADGMTHLSFGLPLSLGPSGWAELVDRFGGAEGVDLDGASSPLDFDADSRAIRGPVAVWGVSDGAFVTLREYAF